MHRATGLRKPILVLCGPSGAGKSTVLKHLFDRYPDEFAFSVSHTSRKPRPGETNGKEYHFIDREGFEQMIKENKFIEYTEFAKNYYGTSRAAIEEIQVSGKRCVLDIDLQGVKSVRRLGLHAQIAFVKPPSVDDLRARLNGRGTESAESLDERLKEAEKDLADFETRPDLCDIVIINDNLTEACRQMENFIFGSSV